MAIREKTWRVLQGRFFKLRRCNCSTAASDTAARMAAKSKDGRADAAAAARRRDWPGVGSAGVRVPQPVCDRVGQR